MGDKSAEIRAGIVVLIAIAILGAGLFVVTGGWEQFRPKEYYKIYFRDAGGISGGDTVLLNGLRAGEVKEIKANVPKRVDGKDVRHMEVKVELYAGSEIPVDSKFEISKTITNVATLYIKSGDDKRLANEATDNLFGRRRARFDETIDIAKQKLDTAEDMIKEFKGLASDARAKLADLDIAGIQKKIDGFLETAQRFATKLETMVKDDEGKIQLALTDFQTTLANVKDLSADLKRDWPEIEGKVQTILANVTELSADAKGVLKENRPDVRALVQNIKDFSHRIGPFVETLETMATRLDKTVIELRPELVQAVKDAGRAFENFKSVTEDLKTAPWKLVNKPSGKESDEVHLYNAVRLYVDAAGKINENIEDLDTLRQLGVLEDPDRADLVARTLEILQQSLKEFEKRERKLVALMQARAGN
jgi:phospholipid/cholesterol/gamma-HCH transport system substrate-binding protein